MERKLVKQGRNALTITLPAKWLQKKGLKAGNTIDVLEKNNELLIHTKTKTIKTEAKLNLRGYDKSMMFHKAIGKYIEGYDKIIILHNNPKVAKEIPKWLLGMVIEEYTSERIVISNVISVPEENFQKLFRRIGHILSQMAVALEELTEGKLTYADVEEEEHLLDYNTFYCLRYLNKYENTEHAYKYFLLCSTIEEAGDQMKQLAKYIGKNNALAKKVRKGVEDYTKNLFKNDFKNMYKQLRAFRDSLGKKTFVEGIAFCLAETLYNYIGFLIEE